jgi:ABC-type antimicrobial peptide transport system permease subunit
VKNEVAANYFEALGIPLVAGRSFTVQEQETRAPVMVISQSAAHQLWPGKNPLGRRLASWQNRDGNKSFFVVIGVTRDARLTLLSQVDKIDLFFPRPLSADATLLVHTRLPPTVTFQSTFAALRDVNPTLPSQALLMSMEQGPMQLQRLMAEAPAMFATLLGGLALVLAAVGIYGVVSYLVARRTREIGIHLALGAQKTDIVRLVLRQTLRPVVWGAGIGLAGAVAVSVLITRLVLNPEIPDLTYGAGAFPSATLLCVLALLLGVILLAAFIPARRATKVDPMVALRCE